MKYLVLSFLLLIVFKGVNAQKTTPIFGEYAYSITPSNKIGLMYKNRLIIDTTYYAFYGIDTLNNRIWANKSILKVPDHLNYASKKSSFVNQLANEWVLLDLSGNIINGTKVDNPIKFIHQKAIVYINKKICVIDINGTQLTEFGFDKINRDRNDNFYLKENNKWGIMNQQLRWIIHPCVDDISPFIGEYCFAKNKDTLYAIDSNGTKNVMQNHLINGSIFMFLDTSELLQLYEAPNMESFISGYNQFKQLANPEVKRKIENESLLYFINNLFHNHSLVFKFEDESYPDNILKSPIVLENINLDFGELGDIYFLELNLVNDSLYSYLSYTEKAVYSVGNLGFVNENLNCKNYLVANNQLKRFFMSDFFIPNFSIILSKLFIDKCDGNMDVRTHNMSPMKMYKNISNNYTFSVDGLTFYYFKSYYPENSARIEINISPKELMMILKPNTVLYNYYLKIKN